MKEIYHAGTLEGAAAALLRLGEKWNEKSSAIYGLWERNWEHNNNLHVPIRNSESDIYDECDRVAKWSDKKPHKDEADTGKR